MTRPSDDPATQTSPARSAQRNAHTPVRVFRLVVTEGPDAGTERVARGERILVGTHESADLRLGDDTVSRFHCEFEIKGEVLEVRDLGSHNGTTTNGVEILTARLQSGAILRLGQTTLRCDIGIDEIRIPLSTQDRFELLVGQSQEMRALFAVLEKAASSDITVLLEGETGTGKEAAAESLHLASSRRDRPFLVVDCGAIPDALLESELFGHEQGAFTGAGDPRPGIFENADGGTLFLDEIGELSPALQPVLLRALERKEIKRVGSDRWKQVDVRVIAATNRDLRAEVNAQRFRSDLYYRLAVLTVRLPALRDRLEDLPLLVRDLLESMPGDDQMETLHSDTFFTELARHSWPGNVRELRNYVERCVAMKRVEPAGSAPRGSHSVDYGALGDPARPLKTAREHWNRALEREYVVNLLAAHEGNITAAARAAEVDRAYLYRLLWRHGLK